MGIFRFKQFDIDDSGCGMKICSDSVLLGAWFLPRHSDAKTIADIGAGSGLLALMAAQCCPMAVINALEIDHSAAMAASRNFETSAWRDRLNLFEGHFGDFVPASPYDIIISNPPYFATGEKAGDNARATARHQATLSYASLIAYSALHLAPHGHLGLIAPYGQCDDIIFEAELKGLKLRHLCHLSARSDKAPGRTIFDFSPADGATQNESISIRNEDGSLNRSYKTIVEPFYTKIS